MNTRSLTSAALLLGFAAAAASPLQGADRARVAIQGQRQDAEQALRVRGDVLGFKTVDLRNQRQDHLLVRIRTQSGRTAVVDLGPAAGSALGLQRGDTIVVKGTPGTIGARTVLQANRLQVLEGQRQQQAAVSDASARIQGTVEAFKRVRLAGQNEDRILARVRLRDGAVRVVDFGPRFQRFADAIQSGTQVTILGARRTIAGRDVLIARKVRVDGQAFRIDRRDPAYRNGSAQTARRSGADGAAAQGITHLTGRVVGFKQVRLQGQQQPHILARVRIDQNRYRIVDLGPRQQLRNRQLSDNDLVRITGRFGTIDGRRVLMANHVEVRSGTGDMAANR